MPRELKTTYRGWCLRSTQDGAGTANHRGTASRPDGFAGVEIRTENHASHQDVLSYLRRRVDDFLATVADLSNPACFADQTPRTTLIHVKIPPDQGEMIDRIMGILRPKGGWSRGDFFRIAGNHFLRSYPDIHSAAVAGAPRDPESPDGE